VDGVIFLPVTQDLEPLHILRRAGIAVVVLERFVPGFSCILADEHCGGLLATQHLLDLSHRRIGCIAHAGDSTSSVARAEGYRAALLQAKILRERTLILECDEGYVPGNLPRTVSTTSATPDSRWLPITISWPLKP